MNKKMMAIVGIAGTATGVGLLLWYILRGKKECAVDADCPTGYICVDGICVLEDGNGGQGSFDGRVTDCDTNVGIFGATVSIYSSDYSDSATTDAEGYFSFLNIPAGQYQVTYSAEGYITDTEVEALREGDTRDISVCLSAGVTPPQGYIHFHAHDCSGQPYYDFPGVMCWADGISGVTDEEGCCNVYLDPGVYQISFDMPSGWKWYEYADPMATEVTITAGGYVLVGIYLEPA